MTIIQNNLLTHPNKNYIFNLSNLGCLDVIGNQALEFLQGQLSCDVREVTPNAMRQGAMCNLKGRVLALLDVIDWHGIHLILPENLIADTKMVLAKTALFSQITLKASASYQLLGFYLQNQSDYIPLGINLPHEPFSAISGEQFYCYHLGKGFYLYLIDKAIAVQTMKPFIQCNQTLGTKTWHLLRLYQHQIQIYPASRGLFLPHRLDLHKYHYLSFNKGCYKGQEIIARMHYRSKPKHEIKLLTLTTTQPIQIGQRLLTQDSDRELGELVDFERINKDTYLLAASVIFDCPEQFRLQ